MHIQLFLHFANCNCFFRAFCLPNFSVDTVTFLSFFPVPRSSLLDALPQIKNAAVFSFRRYSADSALAASRSFLIIYSPQKKRSIRKIFLNFHKYLFLSNIFRIFVPEIAITSLLSIAYNSIITCQSRR